MRDLPFSKTHKTAIVTGASSGIGLGIANALLAQGYRVVANSRRIGSSNILKSAGDLALVDGDVGDRATAEALVRTAVERFGSIDLLVNNAGIFISKAFTDYSLEDFCVITRTNLAGFFHISQLAAAQMRKQNAGHVITITASLADQPIASVPSGLANLTKGGLQSATRALALEFANQGVRFNAIAPGVVNTPMHPEATHEFLRRLSPLNRLAEVSEIVAALLYLQSAPFVNGEILRVDGGAHAGKW